MKSDLVAYLNEGRFELKNKQLQNFQAGDKVGAAVHNGRFIIAKGASGVPIKNKNKYTLRFNSGEITQDLCNHFQITKEVKAHFDLVECATGLYFVYLQE